MEADGIDVISLGIGDPDLPTPEPVIEAAARAMRDPATHDYPTNHGTRAFREAVAGFYRDRFGVELETDGEIVPVLGGKEGVSHVALIALDPGDLCLAPDPGYPPYTSGPALRGLRALLPSPGGGRTASCPTSMRFPPTSSSARTSSSSTTRTTRRARSCGRATSSEAVEFARANDLIVVHDNAYSEICFDGYRAPSFLETPGAKDVGVEIFSLSKGWNMTGWRCALMAGNAEIVERYRQLKTNIDSGMFEAMQAAAAAALTEARDFPAEMSAVYERRRDLVAEALRAIGLDVDPPMATPYFWARVPEGYGSGTFSELVLERAAVVVSPGSAYGPSGEGFVRISLTIPDEQLEEAVSRIESALAGATFHGA